MKPMVDHSTLNLKNTAMRGTHFLSRYIMQDALVGLILTYVLDTCITNASHVDAWALYARFLIYWTQPRCKHVTTLYPTPSDSP